MGEDVKENAVTRLSVKTGEQVSEPPEGGGVWGMFMAQAWGKQTVREEIISELPVIKCHQL